MAVLDFQNQGRVILGPGGLTTMGAGSTSSFTIAVLFKRDAENTNSRQDLITFYDDAFGAFVVLINNTDGLGVLVNGWMEAYYGTDVTDGVWYLGVLKGTHSGGTATIRINQYNYTAAAWAGWIDAGTTDNTSATYTAIHLGALTADFPFDGKIAAAAVWTTNLADATVTHATNGLHISVAKALALSPVELWRPGETDPVVSETTSGTADETASADVLIVTGQDPAGYGMGLTDGTDHTATVNETAVATDTATAPLSIPRAVNETAVATDTATAPLSIARAVNETAVATDTNSAAAVYPREVTDAGGLVDSAAPGHARELTDLTGLADTNASAASYVRAVAETAVAGDTATAGAAHTATVTDGAGITDQDAPAALTWGIEVTDGIGVIDTNEWVGNEHTATLNDTAGITDQDAPGALTLGVVVNDLAGIADGIDSGAGAGVSWTATVTDGAGITDQDQPQGVDLGVTITDSVTPTDSQTSQLESTGSVNSILVLTDAIATAMVNARTHTDDPGLTSDIAVSVGPGLTDPAGLTDTVDVVVGLDVSAATSDSAGLTDTVVVALNPDGPPAWPHRITMTRRSSRYGRIIRTA